MSRTIRDESRTDQPGLFSRSQIRVIEGIVKTALAQTGIRTVTNRFDPTPYSQLPELPLGKGEVSTILSVLDEMSNRESPVAAIALADVISGFRSHHTGYAMKKRTDFLFRIGGIQIATYSALQYRKNAPAMDSRKAEATANLLWAELEIVRWYQGGRVNWTNLIQTLQFAISEFRQLPGCTKREGSAHTLLALTYQRQWQQLQQQLQRRPTPGRESEADVLSAKVTHELRSAVVLFGTGYKIPDAVEMVGAVDKGIVEETLSGTGTSHGSHTRSTAPAHA